MLFVVGPIRNRAVMVVAVSVVVTLLVVCGSVLVACLVGMIVGLRVSLSTRGWGLARYTRAQH